MSIRFLALFIESELDVVAARQRAREIAGICSFGLQDQARISTAISELARNVFNYAGKGRIEFYIEGDTSPQVLKMLIEDEGPGISNIDLVLSGDYQSTTGMGIGLIGAKRLMDQFSIETSKNGTSILLYKLFPSGSSVLTPSMIGNLSSKLSQLAPNLSLSEIQYQNRELLRTLDELNARQKQLLQLTQELEDTNRGVVALYAELDEKANHLRRADELKSRFLSNMSHEFRTPLSSIRAISKLLLDRVDGELTSEQEKQVKYILNGAVSLGDLVNDLLDIAKIEAGKSEVKPVSFLINDMFSALRGMLKPLLVSDKLVLNFQQPNNDLELFQDEAKVSQILRNFISNALKFTISGSIDVFVNDTVDGMITISVADTGIGIDEKYLDLIFEEFSQVDNHLQKGVKGTGLGLPLCKSLAQLLDGAVSVESEIGKGSTFSLTLPINFQHSHYIEAIIEAELVSDNFLPVLIIEDEDYVQLIYEKYLIGSEFKAIPAKSLKEADSKWPQTQPVAIILDIMLKGEDSWRWLTELKKDDVKKNVPVIIASSVEDKRKGLTLGADAYYLKPLSKTDLLTALRGKLRLNNNLPLNILLDEKISRDSQGLIKQ